MNTAALRLVVDRDGQLPTIELPGTEGSHVHVHLHLPGSPDAGEGTAPAAPGRSERTVLRRVLLTAGGLVLALVSFDIGARTANDHDRAMAQMRPAGFRTLPNPPEGLPASVRQQLAAPPMVTPPPGVPSGTSTGPAAPDPFGLHP